ASRIQSPSEKTSMALASAARATGPSGVWKTASGTAAGCAASRVSPQSALGCGSEHHESTASPVEASRRVTIVPEPDWNTSGADSQTLVESLSICVTRTFVDGAVNSPVRSSASTPTGLYVQASPSKRPSVSGTGSGLALGGRTSTAPHPLPGASVSAAVRVGW